MTDLSKIWTRIVRDDPGSFPPLDKPVLLVEQDGLARGWYRFHDEKQRAFVCRTYSFTHWRGELMVDFP